MNTHLKIVTIFCLFNCFVVFGFAPCDGQVQWEPDRERAVSEANKTGKYILYHFSADWCRPCRKLESFVFPSPAVARAFEGRVIPVKVDVDLNPDLVRQYGITGIPADVIATPSGRVVVQRHSPSDTDGYIAMMNQLARVDRSMSADNKAIQEKVHELGLTKPLEKYLAQKGGDFVPPAPSKTQAPPSKESLELEDKFVNKRFDVSSGKLVNDTGDEMVFIDSTGSGAGSEVAPMKVTTGSGFSESTTRIINGGDVQQTGTNLDRVFQSDENNKVVANQFFTDDAQITKNQFVQQPAALVEVADVAKVSPQAIETTVAAPVQATMVDSNVSKRVQVDPVASMQQRAQMNVVNPMVKNEMAPPVLPSAPVEPSPAEFALHGKCPVTLIQEGRWTDGHKQYGCVHRGKVYLFSDANKLKLFQNHPDDFSPLLAGYDPVKYMEDGELVDGKEKFGVFMGKSPNLRVVLFSNFENRKKFEADPRMYLSGIRQAEMKATSNKIR